MAMIEVCRNRIYVWFLIALLFGMRGDVRVERLIAADATAGLERESVSQCLSSIHAGCQAD